MNPGAVTWILKKKEKKKKKPLTVCTECDFEHHETSQVPDHRVLVVNFSLTAAKSPKAKACWFLVRQCNTQLCVSHSL